MTVNPVDLSKYVNLAERYHVLGVIPVEHEDDNRDLVAPTIESQKPEEIVVYTTDDKEEANNLCRQGGFVAHNGQFIAVQVWRDSQKQPTTEMPSKPTTEESLEKDF